MNVLLQFEAQLTKITVIHYSFRQKSIKQKKINRLLVQLESILLNCSQNPQSIKVKARVTVVKTKGKHEKDVKTGKSRLICEN